MTLLDDRPKLTSNRRMQSTPQHANMHFNQSLGNSLMVTVCDASWHQCVDAQLLTGFRSSHAPFLGFQLIGHDLASAA